MTAPQHEELDVHVEIDGDTHLAGRANLVRRGTRPRTTLTAVAGRSRRIPIVIEGTPRAADGPLGNRLICATQLPPSALPE